MSIERRTGDRRRRVLYTSHHSESTSHGELARLREARKPAAVYGSKVHRRLRARWFSLVPVRRSTMLLTVGTLAAITVLMCIGHYAAVAWQSVAYRPEIARPLRLDRPDSFGRWWMIAMLTGSAGVSFLIYQLRRHRNDDFAGRYRLWRVVLTVSLLASLQVLVSIVDWCGAILDLAFGERVALSGSDWIRLVVMFGGAILALQLMVEVRRCRVAAATLAFAIGCWLITEAATWNVLEVTTLNRWVLVTTAPLLASSSVFIAALSYLRMLYREVRQIEDSVTLSERWQRMRQSLFDQDPDEVASTEPKPAAKVAPKKRARARDESQRRERVKVRSSEPVAETSTSSNESETVQAKSSKTKERKGWFGRKKPVKSSQNEDAKTSESHDADESESKLEQPKKKRRFSLRLAPPNQRDTESEATEDSAPEKPQKRGWGRRKTSEPDGQEPAGDSQQTEPKKKRSWLRRDKPESKAKSSEDDRSGTDRSDEQKPERSRKRWFGRKKSNDESSGESESRDGESVSAKPSTAPAASAQRNVAPVDNDADNIDPEEIDWTSLSKSERRRLRKQLKRQNRAA